MPPGRAAAEGPVATGGTGGARMMAEGLSARENRDRVGRRDAGRLAVGLARSLGRGGMVFAPTPVKPADRAARGLALGRQQPARARLGAFPEGLLPQARG